jgi:hypothetical protein
VIIASEELGGYANYGDFFWALNKDPLYSAEDIGNLAVTKYADYFKRYAPHWSVTLSAVRTEQLDRFAEELDSWAECVMKTNELGVVKSAAGNVLRFDAGKDDYADLGDFVGLISSMTASSELKIKSADLLDFISQNLVIKSGAVTTPSPLPEYNSGQDYGRAHGIAMDIPKPGQPRKISLNPYTDLAISTATHWVQFRQWMLDNFR